MTVTLKVQPVKTTHSTQLIYTHTYIQTCTCKAMFTFVPFVTVMDQPGSLRLFDTGTNHRLTGLGQYYNPTMIASCSVSVVPAVLWLSCTNVWNVWEPTQCHEIILTRSIATRSTCHKINSNFYVLLHGQEHHGANTKKFNCCHNVLYQQIFTF